MEPEDFIDLSSTSPTGNTNNASCDCSTENEELSRKDVDVGNADTCVVEGQIVEERLKVDAVGNHYVVQEIQEISEFTRTTSNEPTNGGPNEDVIPSPVEGPKTNHVKDSVPSKRPRLDSDETDPSVHVLFTGITRSSKRKLQELLQSWSDWHTKHHSSAQVLNEGKESGEMIFFPSLHVDAGNKASSMCYWMENGTSQLLKTNIKPLDSDAVPLYDRGFSLGLVSEGASQNSERPPDIGNAARCFNCGSYSHSLKECTKPVDNIAVSNARKEHKSKRGQNSGPRISSRYYQSSPGGKFDGLTPGILDMETRGLLGLGDLDPPPWLNRMREIGYPPGYLDPEIEDQPSGIVIYADGSGSEDGESLGERPEAQRKKSVEFPGINGPIPKDADEKLWAVRNRQHCTPPTRQERGLPMNNTTPGSDPVSVQPVYSSYNSMYRSYYEGYGSRVSCPVPRSPSIAGWSPLSRDGGGLFGGPYDRISPRYDSSGSGSRSSRDVFSPDQGHRGRDRHRREGSHRRR